MKIKLVLVDDSDLMRKAIVNLLESDPEIQILGEASSFRQMMRLVSDLRPQIVVMDLHMDDENRTLISEIKSSLVRSRLLAISLSDDNETKALAAAFGAIKLLDKSKLSYELLPAIKRYALN